MTERAPIPKRKPAGCLAWLVIIALGVTAVYYGGLGLYKLLALIVGTVQQMPPMDRICLCIIAAAAMHAAWMRHKSRGER